MIRTKIMATAGPSIDSDAILLALIKNDLSILRLNCSHGDEATRTRHIERLRRL